MQSLQYAGRQLGRPPAIAKPTQRRIIGDAATLHGSARLPRPYPSRHAGGGLLRLVAALERRDPETGRHSSRVAALTRLILHHLEVPAAEASWIIIAAWVHDIGKINLPVALLQKPGALTVEERALMQIHPNCGAAMLGGHRHYAPLVPCVRHHHEHWDGSGYPLGLRGQTIPFGARVIAVADSFDAMTSDRPYRAALSFERARQILEAGRGRQWDPDIVDVLLRALDHRTEPPPPG